jgi:dihydropteroate synthase
MGIINVTPDSFYSGSRIQTRDALLREAEKMLKDGAKMLDVGGMSTRPAATEITAGEELKRVIPAIETIFQNFPEAYISVDSYRLEVVKSARVRPLYMYAHARHSSNNANADPL